MIWVTWEVISSCDFSEQACEMVNLDKPVS
jgi:hypothetical protein